LQNHGYPPRLYWYIAAVLGVAVPVAAGAVVRVALDPPGLATAVGVLLFFGLALLADMKPVPLDVENERVVSLAFVFVVASQILFGWEYAVMSAIVGVLLSQMVERRPPMRSLFNAGQYALLMAMAGGVYELLGGGRPFGTADLPALGDLLHMTDTELQNAVAGSAMSRAKPVGLRRNIIIAAENARELTDRD